MSRLSASKKLLGMIAKANKPSKIFRIEEWAAGLYQAGSLTRKEYLHVLKAIRTKLGVLQRSPAPFRKKAKKATKRAKVVKRIKLGKRLKVVKRVVPVFEQWLREKGYTKGRSGWLSPDKKKFFPL